jgi:hypothetical protein
MGTNDSGLNVYFASQRWLSMPSSLSSCWLARAAFWYWSSNSAMHYPGVYAIDVTDGRLGIDPKTNSLPVWPVRGGQ